MGAVKELITALEEAINPTHDMVVMYRGKLGWYSWISASFWDKHEHEHYRSQRTEIGRFEDLTEVLNACAAYNKMVHGECWPPVPALPPLKR